MEEDNLTKRLFKKSIMDTSNLLKSIPNQRFFEALSNVVDSEWSHPTLLSLLRGDDVDKDTGELHPFIHSFIQAISIAPLQVHYYSEALPTQDGFCVRVSRRNATGNCE